MDASHLYSVQLFPPKSPELASAPDSDSFDSPQNFSAPVARLAAFPASSRSPTSNPPRDRPPLQIPSGQFETLFPCAPHCKQPINFLCVKVTTLKSSPVT